MLLARVVAEVGLEDGIDIADVLFFVAGVVSVLTLWALIRALPIWKRICEFFRWWENFRTDWDGIPARPGHDAVPGFPQRLGEIDGEFKRNGGSTLKDVVYDTNRIANELKVTAAALVGRMDASDEVRAAILSVTTANMEATKEAFLRNGLEPPDYFPIVIPKSPKKEQT